MTRRNWAYDVRLSGGQLSAAPPVSVDRGRPVALPRRAGRFAIELSVGSVLLEQVRFDLPLVDADPTPSASPDKASPALPKGVRTHRVIEVPGLDRATKAELVDRATGQRQRLAWPPVDGPTAAAPAERRSLPLREASEPRGKVGAAERRSPSLRAGLATRSAPARPQSDPPRNDGRAFPPTPGDCRLRLS
jgi:hypothetical protein